MSLPNSNEPLVLRMGSGALNPTLETPLLEAMRQRDPERARRELDAEFLDAASALLPNDAVDCCTVKQRWETAPKSGVRYVAGIDAGFRSDQFGFALTHAEGSKVILDFCRSWKPKHGKAVQFQPVMTEIIETMKRFGARKAFSDQVCNEVIKQYLAEAKIELEQVSTLGRRASGIYATLRAKVLAHEVEFLDNAELIGQLKRLEIIVSGGGQERCEASSGKDDLAIATALAIHEAVVQPKPHTPYVEILRIPARGAAPSPGAYISSRPEDANETRNDFGFTSRGPSFRR